jgi:hypothetical protein
MLLYELSPIQRCPSLSCFPRRSVVLIIFFPTQVIRHIFLATVPLAAFVIFGPQSDLLACWFGWLPCYPRRPKPEWIAVPIALNTPGARPPTPTVPRGLLGRLKEKASPPSDHQYPSPIARTGVSTTDNRELGHEGHPPSSPVSHVTASFLVSNQFTVPTPQAPISRGERPPPYPTLGSLEPGISAS